MPDNTYPPFGSDAGAFTVPRQLNRWLDVNPQGGALRRCNTTITIPAFTAANEWNGYSDIVASFNYEAPNNFSLVYPFAVPSSPNYALCVSYRVGTTVARYLVWDASGSNFNQEITPYTGQPLKKNFRFEIWNTSQGASSQATDIVFTTSKLRDIDYRYGSDAALVGNDGQNNAFDATVQSTSNDAPSSGLLAQFRADTTAGTTWTAKVDNVHVTPATVSTDGDISQSGVIANQLFYTNPFGLNTTFSKGSLANFASSIVVYVVFRINTLGDKLEVFSFAKSSDPSKVYSLRIQTNGHFCLYDFTDTPIGSESTVGFAAGDWVVAALVCFPSGNALVGRVMKLSGAVNTDASFDMGSIAATIATPINFVALDGIVTTADTSVAEFLMYSANTSSQDVYNYLWQRYVYTYNLPLTFPSTSVSATN